jgi:hypothetical protein
MLHKAITVEAIAQVAHEANRAFCATLGDMSQPAWEDAPEWQRKSAITGVQKIVNYEVTKPYESHESWKAEKLADGWVYGEVKDLVAKTHPCIVDYEQLPVEQQMKDYLFFNITNTLLGR